MKIVIFGGSGDLSKRKIFPSLSTINLKSTRIIVYSRSDIATTFVSQLSEFHSYKPHFLSRIDYAIGNYKNINLDINEDYIFYFSVPPHVYTGLLNGLVKFKRGIIAIEKPFASDTDAYNHLIQFEKNNPEFKIVLIDHYLLKPMCVMMPVIKNFIIINESVESMQFIAKEELGIEGRVYFDSTGIVKDIMQNHLTELYASLLCAVPDGNSLIKPCQARNKVLTHTFLGEKHVFGQYRGYETEIGMPSNTETYAKMELKNTHRKYKDIIFTFQAGKGLDEKKTEIRITYKKHYFKKVLESILRTDLTDETDKLRLSQLAVGISESDKIEKELVHKVELVINLAPLNNVTLHVNVDNKENTYVLFEKDVIMKYFEEIYGKRDDHAVIFESLLNNKEVPATSLEEGMNEWRIFGGVSIDISHYYEKGCDDVEHE